jgi:hypothetical protein
MPRDELGLQMTETSAALDTRPLGNLIAGQWSNDPI